MFLKTLTIHNIASIADATIDFQGSVLAETPIFLICGDTGAGKTSILDSICLALYGQTPRMSSSSKEELEISDSDVSPRDKLYANDNSQLLRRGAGEAFTELIFIANDGNQYSARWEVHRNYDKPDRRLQRPRRSLVAFDGSFSETRTGEIKRKVKEIVGLDYDQFCRTAMLAQGEFTRFLKSDRADKSEILEKLTGTEIYSRIGQKIAQKYKNATLAWETLKHELDTFVILTEEQRTMKRTSLDDLTQTSASEIERRKILLNAISWHSSMTSLSEAIEKRKQEIGKLQSIVDSEEFKFRKSLVDLFKTTHEARRIRKDIDTLDSIIAKNSLLLPELQKNLEKAIELEKETATRLATAKNRAAELRSLLEKQNPDQVVKQLNSLRTVLTRLSVVLTSLKSYQGQKETLKILEENLEELGNECKSYNERLTNLELPYKIANENVDRAQKNLTNAELSVSDAVNNLKANLHIGDRCPICDNVIEKFVDQDCLTPIVDALRNSLNEANSQLLEIKTEIAACNKTLSDSNLKAKRVSEKITVVIKDLRKKKNELKKNMESAELNDIATDNLEPEIKHRSQETENSLKILEEKYKEISVIRKNADDANAEERKISSELLKQKEKTSEKRSSLSSLNAKIMSDDEKLKELKSQLDNFFSSHPEINFEILNSISQKDSKEIEGIEKEISEIETSLTADNSRLMELSDQIRKLEIEKPEMTDDQNLETLKDEEKALTLKIKETDQQIGALSQELKADLEMRENYTKKQAEVDKARELVDNWFPLYQKLGDLKGEKFRNVAQSFILRSLLSNANRYLSCFTDRYTLTCNAGTLAILVNDNFRPSDPQPASILSGGESFMASLALALALADLRSQGMTLDIIFIDEGFGTLSPDYLSNVMDTLEKLHSMGGRRVGLISHVPEMKERIPVHINVLRESPAKSRIEVTRS